MNCENCHAEKARNVCARCKLSHYCGSECQREAWEDHKPVCNMRRKYKEEASVRVGDRKLVTIQEDMDLALTRFIEHNRKLYGTAAEILLHSSRPEYDCLHVPLRFHRNPKVPKHRQFSRPKGSPVINLARLKDFIQYGRGEVERIVNTLDNQRHRLVFFEVDYPVGGKYTHNGRWETVFDTRYQFTDIALPGEEPPADMYTHAHVEGLFVVLQSITIPLTS